LLVRPIPLCTRADSRVSRLYTVLLYSGPDNPRSGFNGDMIGDRRWPGKVALCPTVLAYAARAMATLRAV